MSIMALNMNCNLLSNLFPKAGQGSLISIVVAPTNTWSTNAGRHLDHHDSTARSAGPFTTIPSAARNANVVGAGVDLGATLFSNARITLTTEAVAPDAAVTLSLETSHDGLTYTSFSTATFSAADANKAINYAVNNPDEFLRVTATHNGAGNATYGVTITGYDNDCGSPGTPACALGSTSRSPPSF